MIRGRFTVMLGFAGAAAALVLASPAWACNTVTSPVVQSPQPSRVPSGAQVVVSGSQWSPDGAVVLHWQSIDGLALGSVIPDASGSFSRPVVVPADARAGTYYIMAMQGTTRVATVIEVAAAGAVQTQNAPSYTPPTPSGSSQPVTAVAANGGAEAPAPVTPVPGAGAGAGASVPAISTGGVATAGPSAPAPLPAGGAAAASGGGTRATDSTPAAAAAPSLAPRPLTRQGIGDLWAGFAHGNTAVPGLLNVPPAAPISFPVVEIGAAFAALAAMVAGFGIAELRRAKAQVRGSR